MSIQEIRKQYPDYNDLSDQELADRLHNKFYSDIPKNDFYSRIGLNTNIDKTTNKSNSIVDAIKNYIPNAPMPIGLNIASGAMSLMGKNNQEKDIIRNIPQVLTQTQPGISEKLGQGIGEYLPMTLGAGGLGTAERIIANTGYGAAVNPGERLKGAVIGGVTGALAEAIPGAAKGIDVLAEKIRPVKFVKNKISELQDIYKNATSTQKSSYKEVIDNIGKNNITNIPEEFLGFDKNNLSLKAQYKYDAFSKNKDLQSLHELQSQLFKDSVRFKRSNEAEGMNILDKAEIERNNIVNKIQEYLEKYPKYKKVYQEASDLTRDVIKPFESTKAIRDILTGKVNKMMPKKFASTLTTAINKEGLDVPKDHALRQALADIEDKLLTGKLYNAAIPKFARYFSPNIVEFSQNPKIIELLKSANIGYQPLKQGLLGLVQQQK